jgi:hypothetical protein
MPSYFTHCRTNISKFQDINKSFTSIGSRPVTEKGDKMAALMQEAHMAKKERDDALYRLEQVRSSLFLQ